MHATQPQTLIDRQNRREKRIELRDPYEQSWARINAPRPVRRWPLSQAGNLTMACAVPAVLGWICLLLRVPALGVFWLVWALASVAVMFMLKWRAERRRTGR